MGPIQTSTALLTTCLILVLHSICLAQSCERVDYCEEAQKLLVQAQEIRSLAGPKQFNCRTVSGEEYREITTRLTLSANDRSELEYEGKLFGILGVIPAGYDYLGCMMNGSADSSSALYDRRSKSIIFRNDSSLAVPLAIHELTHLLQDYRFNLHSYEKLETTTDARLALAALREGDAMLSETKAKALQAEPLHPECGQLAGSGYSKECEPSELLGHILMFPYEWGLRFASILGDKADGKELNLAFLRPPLTTSEILYPKNFVGKVVKNKGPDFLRSHPHSPGSRDVYTDSLGEFFLRELLKEYAGLRIAGKAAKGWNGDLVTLSNSPNGWKVSWAILVSNASDVAELSEGIRSYVAKRFEIPIDPRAINWIANRAPFTVSLRQSYTDHRIELAVTELRAKMD